MSNCPRTKIVCSTLYYKEATPRVQITLCESVDITDETQRDSIINNINKSRKIQ